MVGKLNLYFLGFVPHTGVATAFKVSNSGSTTCMLLLLLLLKSKLAIASQCCGDVFSFFSF